MRELYILVLTAIVVLMFGAIIAIPIVVDYIINALIMTWRKIYRTLAIINIIIGLYLIYVGKSQTHKGWAIISISFGIAFFINAWIRAKSDSNERTTVNS